MTEQVVLSRTLNLSISDPGLLPVIDIKINETTALSLVPVKGIMDR